MRNPTSSIKEGLKLAVKELLKIRNMCKDQKKFSNKCQNLNLKILDQSSDVIINKKPDVQHEKFRKIKSCQNLQQDIDKDSSPSEIDNEVQPAIQDLSNQISANQ